MNNTLITITIVLAAIWLIFTVLEKIILRKKSISISEKTPLQPQNDYITEIYNSKVGDADGRSNDGNDNGASE